VILTLIGPCISIIISQFLRNEFYISNYDAPLRFVLCVPIFLCISQGCTLLKNENTFVEIWITRSIPMGIIFALISRGVNNAKQWEPYKTTYFVDPLTFCNYTTLFSMLSILGIIYFHKKLSLLNILFLILSIIAGFYLSITSGARTGWLSMPIFIIIFWTVLNSELNKIAAVIYMLILMLGMCCLIYLNPYLIGKLLLGWQQLISYRANELNVDSSVSMRLSFIRMGFMYFIDRPWTGWGDLSWIANMDRPEFIKFASEEARLAPIHGFHNEIITSAVRSGVWGLFASLAFFVVPLYLAVLGLRTTFLKTLKISSIILLLFMVHIFIAGLTTEITNLTFLASFLGVAIVTILGENVYLLKLKKNITK